MASNPIDSLKWEANTKGDVNMIHPLVSYPDGTEIVCSDIQSDGKINVTIETPVYGGFRNAVFSIPDCTWKKITGYTEAEIADYEEKLKQLVEVIFEVVRDGVGD